MAVGTPVSWVSAVGRGGGALLEDVCEVWTTGPLTVTGRSLLDWNRDLNVDPTLLNSCDTDDLLRGFDVLLDFPVECQLIGIIYRPKNIRIRHRYRPVYISNYSLSTRGPYLIIICECSSNKFKTI